METTYALNENESLQEIKRPPRIGFIKTFAGTTTPEGTLLCDGSAVSRDTYSELFAAIGTTWGEGDGSTTFNLPDLRDQWILCAGTEHEAGESVAEGLPNITGTTYIGDYGKAIGMFYSPNGAIRPGVFSGYVLPNTIATEQDVPNRYDQIVLDASYSNNVYGASGHVTPKSTVLTPCIVYE